MNENYDNQIVFNIQVTSNDKKWILSRSLENFRYLDKHLHDCIFDRKFSCLQQIDFTDASVAQMNKEQIRKLKQQFAVYLTRFCEIAFINSINCGPILNWFEVSGTLVVANLSFCSYASFNLFFVFFRFKIDNKGNRLYAIDDSPINIPGVAAAVVKKRYVAQSLDELSLEVGNMISVIDMPPTNETVWWRGKKSLEVNTTLLVC
jgi:hypothetical protein